MDADDNNLITQDENHSDADNNDNTDDDDELFATIQMANISQTILGESDMDIVTPSSNTSINSSMVDTLIRATVSEPSITSTPVTEPADQIINERTAVIVPSLLESSANCTAHNLANSITITTSANFNSSHRNASTSISSTCTTTTDNNTEIVETCLPSSSRSTLTTTNSALFSNLNNNNSASGGAKPSFCFDTLSLHTRTRMEVGGLLNSECCRGGPTPDLNTIIDTLFDPTVPIDNHDNIEWIRWLIAGGRTLQEFVKIVRSYDNHAKCGLVWVPHVVAYRCRTCGISPCMSICRDCFKKGNHVNHDFNMFLSQAGGACDCGDTSVMKAEGFCSDHGINNRVNKEPVPKNLLAVAEVIMPKMLFRLLQHFREHSDVISQAFNTASHSCEKFTNMLIDLNNMGEIMRKVMTRALISVEVYKSFNDINLTSSQHAKALQKNREKYEEAVNSFPVPEPPDEYRHLPALGKKLIHSSLLEEFIFWTFKFEFPQNLVCFLLNMLPNQEYKEHLTRTFVMHYSRIPCVLETSRDPDTLSNRVVHMSVQLFSNEYLALKMVKELSLLHVMIISLKLMMTKISIPSTLHDKSTESSHSVIDCTRQIMKDHCYWPLVSDFNNVLSHESVALVFLRDDNLIDMWFQFLSKLQGMNVNVREIASHVEFEPNSYYAAFSCELEASAYPMWSIISHLQDGKHADLAKKIITYCISTLHEWLDAINYNEPKISPEEKLRASFHFPLHRYLAAFVCQAVTKMGMSLSEILPTRSYILSLLMMHPLRVQSFFYEILAGIWVRNGLQIKGQAMTYIQANFCNSMADMDLFFLQICATNMAQSFFLQSAIDMFGVGRWLEKAPLEQSQKVEQTQMLEGFLTFLATLVTSRTNLGNDEATQCILEISALLATDNKTHSQLLELMPERSGNVHTKNFEMFLKKLSVYKAPSVSSENLEQGMFTPIDEVWEEYYDPLHVLLRAVHRRDFQSSLDRFTNYVKSKNKMPPSGNLWPPFRLPRPVGPAFTDPCRLLSSRIFHSTILSILYRAVHFRDVSEHLLALAIFLLEIAVETSEDIKPTGKDKVAVVECENLNTPCYNYCLRIESPKLFHVYPTDNLSCNLRHVVKKISLKSQDPQVTPAHFRSDHNYADLDYDLDTSDIGINMSTGWEYEDNPNVTIIRNNRSATHSTSTAIVPISLQNMEVALPTDLSVVPETGLVLRQNSQDDSSFTEETHAIENINSSSTSMEFRFALQPITMPETGMEVAIRDNAVSSSSNSRLSSQQHQRNERHQNEMFLARAPTSIGMLMSIPRVQPVSLIPTNNRDVVPSSSLMPSGSSFGPMGNRRPYENLNRKRSVGNVIDSLNKGELIIDESIISLLLKLHSQLSGTLDSFSLNDEQGHDTTYEKSSSSQNMDVDNDVSTSTSLSATTTTTETTSQRRCIKVCQSRIGDAPYFIGNLLRKIALYDELCAQNIDDIRQRLWPNQREKQAEQKAREAKEKEERRKKAEERKKKMLEEIDRQQKQFSQYMDTRMDDEDEFYEEQPREKEYDCIICNCTTPSTESNPIGLVVLVESSGIVGHRRCSTERLPLPLSDYDEERLKRSTRLAMEFNRRTDLLSLKYGEESWYLSNNMAYQNGVHVQSCGHHVHLSCLEAYLKTLYATQRQHLHELGEFYCPVCRQLSNSVLPLSPQLDRLTPMVRTGNQTFQQLVAELTNLIKENEKPTTSTKLSEAMGRAMKDMTNITHGKMKRVPPTFRSLFIFVTSIARTNLEAEIIQRGGSLCSTNTTRYKPRRECIVPLLHVLSVHVRVLAEWPLWSSWAFLSGMSVKEVAPVPVHCREAIPTLMADPIALLLKFILLAPLHLGQEYFTCMVKVMYNLLYYQIVVQLCSTLSDLECDYIMANAASNCIDTMSPDAVPVNLTYLCWAMALVLKCTNRLNYIRHENGGTSTATININGEINFNSLETQLQTLCLPFLRVAAILRQHLYHHEMPEILESHWEFVHLLNYLELVDSTDMNWDSFSASKGLCFIKGTEELLPRFWCEQLINMRNPMNAADELIILNQHVAWQQPKLLELPREYERLFTYYHERPCLNCYKVPKESSICLFCGTIVCLKQNCCVEKDCCEAVRHTIVCGGGIGIFLVVTSTYIIVIRGRRACLWGSLYLDDFDEEDRDLKRGKPLYLSQNRFNLLESQWLSHKFAHTKQTWVFHRDLL